MGGLFYAHNLHFESYRIIFQHGIVLFKTRNRVI